MMKIVVIDGYTLNGGDLDWKAIEAFGSVMVYDRTPVPQLIERCRDADIVITNKTPFSRETLTQLPRLKLIAVTATGYNVVDTAAAAVQGIAVCNVPGYGTASVAQHVFALLLELTNHVGVNARSVAGGGWVNAADWCYSERPVMELEGKVLGIVGFGHIGQRTARIGQAFGMDICYYSRSLKNTSFAQPVDLTTLFRCSDVVSLHCPFIEENAGFVNGQLLAQMKPTALLINTARGQLIDETDLANALHAGIIAGAGLDVLSIEPPLAENPLLGAPNCIITPHNAWISREARQRIMDITASNIGAFLTGSQRNIVN